MSESVARGPWSARLDLSDVPETGRHVELVADGETRAAVAALAGVAALPRLAAEFDVTRHGRNGLRVVGRVSAMVAQTCVVTLEPIESLIDEPIDLAFVPSATPASGVGEVEIAPDAPEELVDGAVDLGAIATEFLILGIDPYPRKEGAVFEAPAAADDSAHPFAALAALTTPDSIRGSGQRGNSKVPAPKGQKKGQGGKQG